MLLLLLALSLSACFRDPKFAVEPFISFNSISTRPMNGFDSVYITINFRDGDGNLGLAGSDQNTPFQPLNPDGTPNLFFNNFFVGIQKKERGRFVNVTLPDGQSLSGRFPLLNLTGNTRPLEGRLTYSFQMFVGVFGSPIRVGDTVRFEIQIADRALNLSNVIETDEVVARGRMQ